MAKIRCSSSMLGFLDSGAAEDAKARMMEVEMMKVDPGSGCRPSQSEFEY